MWCMSGRLHWRGMGALRRRCGSCIGSGHRILRVRLWQVVLVVVLLRLLVVVVVVVPKTQGERQSGSDQLCCPLFPRLWK